jgi:hypothetical protein
MADGRRRQTFSFDINVRKISEGTARERTNSITISGNYPNVAAGAHHAHQAWPSPKPIWPEGPRWLNPSAAGDGRGMVVGLRCLPMENDRGGQTIFLSHSLLSSFHTMQLRSQREGLDLSPTIHEHMGDQLCSDKFSIIFN